MKLTGRKILTLSAAAFAAVFGLALTYLLLLCFPQPLFAYHLQWENLKLYSDEPIAPEAPEVLADVQRRLELCPLYAGHPRENIFVCNHFWRYRLLTNLHDNAGGNAYAFAPQNAFLRKADLARNVMFRSDGKTLSGPDRPLAYFMAHEIAHDLTARAIGAPAFFRLPAWKCEGYADYVGKGGEFNFKKNLALFKKNDPALNPHVSGLYLRYHLMVAYLLDHQKLSVQTLLTNYFDPAVLEQSLRSLPN